MIRWLRYFHCIAVILVLSLSPSIAFAQAHYIPSRPGDVGFTNVFSVRSYGAKGDNTTDDTTAFQNAETAAAAQTDSCVLVPPGTYKLTGEVVASAGNPVAFIGYGPAISVLNQTTFGDAAIQLQTSGCIVQNLGFVNTQTKTVIGGNFNGVPARNRAAGVYIVNASQCRVQNCRFIGGVCGVSLRGNSSNNAIRDGNNRVTDCAFSGLEWGVLSQDQNFLLLANLGPCLNTIDATDNPSAGATKVLTPQSMDAILLNEYVYIDSGANAEIAQVTAVTGTTFTVNLAKPHTQPFTIQGCWTQTQGANPPHQVYTTGSFVSQRSSNVVLSNCNDQNNLFGAAWAIKFVDNGTAVNLSCNNCERGLEAEGNTYYNYVNLAIKGMPNVATSYAWNSTTLWSGDTQQAGITLIDCQNSTIGPAQISIESPNYLLSDTTDTFAAGARTFTVNRTMASVGLIIGSVVDIDVGVNAERATVTAVSGSTFTCTTTLAHTQPFPVFLPAANTTGSDAQLAVGSVTMTPASMSGIAVNSALLIDGANGGNAETVIVASIGASTFTTTTTKSHTTGYTIVGTGFADGVRGLAVRSFNSQNSGGFGSTDLDIRGVYIKTYYSSGATSTKAFDCGGISNISFESCTHLQLGDVANGSSYGWYSYNFFVPNPGPYTTTDSTDNFASGTRTFTPVSMAGIGVGSTLSLDSGGSQEYVTVTAVAATTFTCVAANAHNGTGTPFVVSVVIFPSGINIIAPRIYNATSLFNVSAHVLNLNLDINTDWLPSGVGTNSISNGTGGNMHMIVHSGQVRTLSNSQTPTVIWGPNFQTQGSALVVYKLGSSNYCSGQTITIQGADANTIIPNSVGVTVSGWTAPNISFAGGVATTNSAVTSSSGAATLNCTSVTGMVPGMQLLLDPGTANQEVVTIASFVIATNIVTTTANLAHSHTTGAVIVSCWQSASSASRKNAITLTFDGTNWHTTGWSY